MSEERPLTNDVLEFWLKNDPTCPVKASRDGGLLIFLANDYALEIRPGGKIACKGPDHYRFSEVTLITGMPMEGNVTEGERPRS